MTIVTSSFFLDISLFQDVEAKQMQIATLIGYEAVPPVDTDGAGIFIMGPASISGVQYMAILTDIANVTSVIYTWEQKVKLA